MTTSKYYSPRHHETKEELYLHKEKYTVHKENGDYKYHEVRTWMDTTPKEGSRILSTQYTSPQAVHDAMSYHNISSDQYVVCEVTITYGTEIKELT